MRGVLRGLGEARRPGAHEDVDVPPLELEAVDG